MKEIAWNRVFSIILFLVYGWVGNNYFGWNWQPQSGMEILFDGSNVFMAIFILKWFDETVQS